MTDPVKELSSSAADAKKWLAAAFNFVQDMISDEQRVESDIGSGNLEAALHDTRRVLRDFNLAARAERRVDSYDDDVSDALEELKDFVDEDVKKVEEFLKQLKVAMAKLKRLASFYRGDLKEEVGDLEDSEQNELKLQKLVEKLPEDESLQKKLQAAHKAVDRDLEELKQSSAELKKWVESNTALVTQIQNWGSELESQAA